MLDVLTERELQVLKLVAEGKSNKEIARALCITVHTAKAHVSRILYKLAVNNRTDAAVLWTKHTHTGMQT
jgi:NarL family two-component system response regulator LiaR